MADDVTLVRRRRLLAHVQASGGTMALAELHDWSALKLLAAHQAFSQLMEGLVDDGMVRWDGGVFTLTDDGRAEAELAPKRGARRAAGRPAAEQAVVPTDDPDDQGLADPSGSTSERAPSADAAGGAPVPEPAPTPAPAPPPAAPSAPPPAAEVPSGPSVDAPLPHVAPPRVGLLRRALRRLGRLIDRR